MPSHVRVERRSIGESRVESAYYGPCFVCEQETRYVGFTHAHDADEWLKKQFRPNVREGHIETLRTGRRQPNNQYVLGTLEGFLCPPCRESCERSRQRHKHDKKLAEERKQRTLQRINWLTTWRDPEPGEFDRTTTRRAFSAYSREGLLASLFFRARVCLTEQCRGNSPAHRVAMWADGRLIAHYYGWELPDFSYTHDGPFDSRLIQADKSDLFGPGLARWLEKDFQPLLVAMKPHAVWDARPRVFGRREDANWTGWESVSDIGMNGPLEPSLIHTVAADGSIYASLRNFYFFEAVSEFVAERFRMEIRESWMAKESV